MVTPSCRGTANAMMRPSSTNPSSTGSSSRSSSQAEPPEGPEKLEGSTSSILPLPLSTNKVFSLWIGVITTVVLLFLYIPLYMYVDDGTSQTHVLPSRQQTRTSD